MTNTIYDPIKLEDELNTGRITLAHLAVRGEDFPKLEGYDISGQVFPYSTLGKGVGGGDHLSVYDFGKLFDFEGLIKSARRKNNQKLVKKLEETSRKTSFLLLDVAGHNFLDNILASQIAMMYSHSLPYEFEQRGEFSIDGFYRIMDTVRERFSSRMTGRNSFKFVTAHYGELDPEKSTFRYISAGHPYPIVFSGLHGRGEIVDLHKNQKKSGFPIGLVNSKASVHWKRSLDEKADLGSLDTNKLELVPGDIMILHSDGLSEHPPGKDRRHRYVESQLRDFLCRNRDLSAQSLVLGIKEDMQRYAPLDDDLTLAVIKKLK